MDLRHYLTIILRRKWIIAATFVATMIVVIAATLLMPPVYSAIATIRIATASAGAFSYTDYMYADRVMNTYVLIATTAPVLDELKQELNIEKLPDIEVEIVPNTELIQITVEDSSPSLAADVANHLSSILVAQSETLYSGGGKSTIDILMEQLNQIEGELATARSEYESLVLNSPDDTDQITALNQSISLKQEMYANVLEQYEEARVREAIRANIISILEPAEAPLKPSKPNLFLNTALGLVVGMAGGFGLAFLFESLDTTLNTSEQIESVTQLPVFGEIPDIPKAKKYLLLENSSVQIDAFHRLRTKILGSDQDGSTKTIMVTSAEPGEGKSMVITNLALSLAQAGQRVILIDCDLRKPKVHRYLNLPNVIGLSNWLEHKLALDEVIQTDTRYSFRVITSGQLPADPTQILGKLNFPALIVKLKLAFDYILLDSPALLSVADGVILAQSVDRVLLIVSRTKSHQDSVQKACRQLVEAKAKNVAVIINRAEHNRRYYYYQQRDHSSSEMS